MPNFLSITEQVAVHLRDELLDGRWTGTMPGRNRLAEELRVNRKTVEAALRQLEHEGLLVGRGSGRKRSIELPPDSKPVRKLRVAILNYEPLDLTKGYMIELRHLLTEAGHSAFFMTKSQTELGMDLSRISRLVHKTVADAWVVTGGSSEILEWFSTHPLPTIALFGRRRGLPIAGVGPDKPPSYAAATRRLLELGHRRIVLLTRQPRRLPKPGAPERAFLGELTTQGITPSPYHLPDWEGSADGFHEILDSLFRHTPPSALLIDESPFFTATQQFLATRGLRAPEDLSLICSDGDPHFNWCRPSVAHIRWDSHQVIRRVVRWAAHVSQGRANIRQTLTRTEFVDGGTVGPVNAERK